MQKLLILRCFRSDRLLPAIRNFIEASIGEEFLISPVVDFNQIFTTSASNVPVLMYASNETDAVHQILRVSHNYHGANIISIDHTANDVCKFQALHRTLCSLLYFASPNHLYIYTSCIYAVAVLTSHSKQNQMKINFQGLRRLEIEIVLRFSTEYFTSLQFSYNFVYFLFAFVSICR